MTRKWQEATDQILSALDLRAVFSELGVEIVGEPSEEGWAPARAVDRPDLNPSAAVNLTTARYKDHGGSGINLSLFEFAAHVGKFPDWKEARKHYAKQAGVKLPRGREPHKGKPDEKLKFRPWNDMLVFSWCDKKKGITPEAVKLAGGRLASWPSTGTYTVIAFPIYGAEGVDSEPIGYTLYNITGGTLPDGQGNPRKMILAGGSKKGWLGQWGLRKLTEAQAVIKCEGTTDLLAVMSAMAEADVDDVAVISNSHGSTENPTAENCSILAGKVVYVIHDADEAGEAGGKKWATAIAQFADVCRHARLLYEIKPDHGEDVRDWINDGGTFQGLMEICEQAELVNPPEESISMDSRGDSLDLEEAILNAIGLQVMGEMEGGKVEVFSKYHRKSDIINDVSRLTFHRLLQLGGPGIRSKVHPGQEDLPGLYAMSRVKEAIAIIAGHIRITDEMKLGRGIWRGKDEFGEDTDNLILVGAGESVIRNGKPDLQRVEVPRFAGRLLHISDSHPWYRFEDLEKLYADATPEWMADVVEELEELIARWKWTHQGQAPKVAVGLILATWIQTIWNWRPQVVVTGKSTSGKTTFFEILKDLFGSLTVSFTANTTAPGLQQSIKNTAEIAILDEIDKNKNRPAIFDMLRASGGGGQIGKGTPGQKSHKITLQHIVWLAGIDDGMNDEADLNRFVHLALVKPANAEMGKLNIPPRPHLGELGKKLLIVAVKIAFEAKRLAESLCQERFPDSNYRVVENFSVPAACYSIVFPDAGSARSVLERMLTVMDREIEEEEQQLLDAILMESSIYYNQKHRSVSAAISDLGSIEALETIESAGVGIIENYNHEGRFLFINKKTVQKKLLKGTEWERRNLDQVLLRIAGAERCRHRLGGSQCRGVKVPFSQIEGLKTDESPF